MKKPLISLLIIFGTNALGMYYSWYLKFWWFDVANHFLGGFFVAMLMAAYLIGAATFIGVVWEFSEYIANQILVGPFYRWFQVRTYFMGDLQDTISDLLLDILGATLFTTYHLLRSRKAHEAESRLQNQSNSGAQ